MISQVDRKIVVVTGAPGFVGGHVCQELVNAGYHVRAIHRKNSKLDFLKTLPVEFIEADINQPESLQAAFAGATYVFHLAALYREAKFPDSEYWRVNFEGTKNVLEVARQQQVKRVVYCSTTGVHGNIDKPPATEEYRYSPCDVYQESKTEAEKYVKAWVADGKGDACIIRPTMIWGPRDTRIFKLFKGIYTKKLPIIGDGKTLNHWILVEDLARAFRLAAESDKAKGQVYLIGDERIVTLEYTMQTIAKEYGVSLLPFKIPAWPIQLIGSAVETLVRPFGIEPPIHRRRADFFIKSRAFDCTKAKEHLGYQPRMKFEEEAAYVARWYKENGWLN